MSRRRLLAVVAVVALTGIYLTPFAIQVVTSLKTDADAAAHPLSPLPHPVTLDAWRTALTGGDLPVLRWLANSLGVTLAVTCGRVVLDAMAAYALSRLRYPGRRATLWLVLGVLTVPGVALLVPKFLVVTYLGIYDTYAAMVLPLLVDATGVLILKQYFDGIPVSVEEAARLDGASVWRTFRSVVLPMARPALATVAVLSFQSSWNEFGHFLVTTGSPDHRTLVTGLADLTAGGLGAGSQHPLKMATALLTTAPVVLVFLLAQRFLVRGGREGAAQD